jgi:hexosaminidase
MKSMAALCLLVLGLAGLNCRRPLGGPAACRARFEPPAAASLPALIPQPLEMTVSGGRFILAPGTAFLSAGVEAEETDRRKTAKLLHDLQALLVRHDRSADPSMPPEGSRPRPTVLFSIEPGERERLGDEGYSLKVSRNAVVLRAARPAGLFYGGQSLRLLLLGQMDAHRHSSMSRSLPCLEILDRPRYSWRGFMLDCCRHFFPKEFIKKCLDEMALFKLNRFHWHLTDDQAWRIEIKKYPELTEKSGNGRFYSPEDVREIVAYAAERFITVVPEIEMPGHATAALTAFPGLSCTGGPFASMPQWGVFEDVFCAGNEETFAFLSQVLEEVAALFPGPWVHIGGDECPKSRWRECPKCQARMMAEGFADPMELQGWFVRRMERRLNGLGKRLIGWDEILEGGLAPEAAVMSWRGMEGGIEAVRQGHDVVMAPTTHVYLDYYQGDPRFEPAAIGGFLPLSDVYAFEPTPPGLSAAESAHILGGQANLWTEYIVTTEHASTMMWPRLCALAEAVWSPAARRDWQAFLFRLGKLRPGLESMGLRVAPTTWRPEIRAKAQPGQRSWQVDMTAALPGARIRYTCDGSDPDPGSRSYRGPFACRSGGAVRAALFDGRRQLGPIVELLLVPHLAVFAAAKVSAPGKLRPEAGGEALLVDGISGSLNHKDGAWLGVEGSDLEVIIDLGGIHEVSRVAARFLEHPAAWIFLPLRVETAVSPDGRSWTASVVSDRPFAGDLTVLGSHEADARFLPLPVRYVRLVARGIGACPPGHTGAGGKAWLFIDEIVVQ